jgi:hypothetical protein
MEPLHLSGQSLQFKRDWYTQDLVSPFLYECVHVPLLCVPYIFLHRLDTNSDFYPPSSMSTGSAQCLWSQLRLIAARLRHFYSITIRSLASFFGLRQLTRETLMIETWPGHRSKII